MPFWNKKELECENCRDELEVPYIICSICDINICTLCFSKGAEFNKHENNHPYYIFNDSIILFKNSKWTAKEEVNLLNSLLQNQNFTLAKKVLSNYSVKEIRQHYDHYYLQRNGHDSIPVFSNFEEAKTRNAVQVVPYTITLNNTDDPPRYTPSSIGYQSISGYNPFRADFEIDYDGGAEDLLNVLSAVPDRRHKDYNLISNLQCAIVQQYNRHLQERQRRRDIIRRHGLICLRKMYSWLHRYETTIGSSTCEQLLRFAQYYSGEGFEKLMEGFHCAGELKTKIARYCDYYKKGIRTIPGIQLHLKIKSKRDASLADIKSFQKLLPTNLKLKQYMLTHELGTLKKRGGFSPLEVEGFPGYDKLTSKEQELCRKVRLVPLSYCEFRDLLVDEYRKNGNLKLQTARKLLKIDVNKTRRLYDFLIQEGYINLNK